MTADTDSGDTTPDPMEDADAWTSLSREEQSDILDEGLADLKGERGEYAWRHLTDREKQETVAAIEGRSELSETEQAMQAALDDTWTADVFADLDDVPTVPFECRELSSEEQAVLQDALTLVQRLEKQAERLDDADSDDVAGLDVDSQYFDSADELDEYITFLLASVTTDDAFDEERFRTGRGLRSNTRRLLFLEIALRYQEEQQRALQFRTE